MTNKYMNKLKDKGFYVMLLASVVIVTVLLVIVSFSRNPKVAKNDELDLNKPLVETQDNQNDGNNVIPDQSNVLESDTTIPTEDVTNVVGNSELGDNFLIVKEDQEDKEQQEETPKDETKETFIPFNGTKDMMWPVNGKVLWDYSMDKLVYDITLEKWTTHDKLCLSAKEGQDVLAAASGQVVSILRDEHLGISVVIDHGDGWKTTYGQLDKDLNVAINQPVKKGDVLGSIATPSIFSSKLGHHLDFSVSKDDKKMDPKNYLAD